MKTGIILRTQSGDWEGLYVDGNLISEDHELNDINDWIYWTNKYGLSGVVYRELEDEDGYDISILGSFYETLGGFKGKYEN